MTPTPGQRLEGIVKGEWVRAWIKEKRLGSDAQLRLTSNIDDEVASSVFRAIKEKVVEPTGRGSFILPGHTGKAGIFWHGRRSDKPRRVYFAYEGLLTVAAAGDLHHLGWSATEMRFEVIKGAFDLGVFDERSGRLLIACEAKTKVRDVGSLVTQIEQCGRRGPHAKAGCPRAKTGHPKYEGLISSTPELLWVVAPGDRRLFSVTSLGRGFLGLVPVADTELMRKPKKQV